VTDRKGLVWALAELDETFGGLNALPVIDKHVTRMTHSLFLPTQTVWLVLFYYLRSLQ